MAFGRSSAPRNCCSYYRDDCQAIEARSLEIEAADAKTTVADYKHDLFSGPRKVLL
jgi:hypothetical protein